jgi:acetoin utilization protein AcuB
MKASALMIPDPITITDRASIQEAIELMKVNSIRHLPVVGTNRQIKGLVTLADLRQGLIPSMLGDVTLKDLMIRRPVSASPNDDIEVVARLIYTHKISGMPVVKGGKVVGIITETDILRAFIDMLGILTASSRIDVVVGEEPDAFKKALQIIGDCGAKIINVGMAAQPTGERIHYFRLSPCKTAPIKKALKKGGFEVVAAVD